MSKEQMDNFEDWWELKGSRMKVESGETLYDSELPYRVAKALWKTMMSNNILVNFKSDDSVDIKTLVSALEGAIDGWIRCYIAYDLEHDIGQKESFQNLQRKIDFKEAKQVLERYYRNQGQKKAARKDQ